MVFIKHILSNKRLVLAIPILFVAFLTCAILFAAPVEAKAQTVDAYVISLSDQEGSYGNLFYEYCEYVDMMGEPYLRIHGTVSGTTFTPVALANKDAAAYYVHVCDLRASLGSPSAPAVPFIDDHGLIVVAPSDSFYYLKCVYTQNGENFAFELFQKAATPEEADVYKGDINGFASGECRFKVTKKEINVAIESVNFANNVHVAGIDIPEEDGYKIIERTFGDGGVDSIVFAAALETPLAFASHKLVCPAEIKGNETESPVGEYTVEFSNENIHIYNVLTDDGDYENDEDITDYYIINCDEHIKVKINRLSLKAPAQSTKTHYYSDQSIIRNEQNEVIGTAFDIMFQENVAGHPGWVVTYKGSLQYDEDDLDDTGNLKITGTDPETGDPLYLYYTMSIYRVSSGTDLPLTNFLIDYNESMKDNYRTVIEKREIYIYIEGNPSESYPEELGIAIPADGFSQPYGNAYTRSNSRVITIQSTQVTLEFDIQGFDALLEAEDHPLIVDGDKLILNRGEYGIVNPHVGDNNRYNIHVDRNMFYTVTAKEASVAELYSSSKVKTELQKKGDEYNIYTEAYGVHSDAYQMDFVFYDDDLDVERQTITATVTFNLLDGKPGVYFANGFAIPYNNYAISDYQTLTVEIERIALSVSMEASHEFDGLAVIPVVTGGTNAIPFTTEVKYCAGKNYNDQAATLTPPVTTGKYSFKIFLGEGDEIYYHFNEQNAYEGQYTIAQRPVRVVVTLKKNSKVFGEVLQMQDVASYQVFYDPHRNGDSEEAGMLGEDRLGELRFYNNCNNASALPGTYAIRTAFDHENYTVTTTSYKGAGTTDAFYVNKLPLNTFVRLNIATVKQQTASVRGDSITLPSLSVYGTALTNVVIAYCKAGEDSYTVCNGLTAGGLEEGTVYSVRYVVKKSNNLVALNENYEGVAKNLTTTLTAPVIKQIPSLTTSSAIAVELQNYDAANAYAYEFDGEERTPIANESFLVTEESVDEQTVTHVYYLFRDLEASSDHEIIFVRLTQDTYASSARLIANTASVMPAISKSNIEISATSISVTPLEGTFEEDDVVIYEYIKVDSGYTTYGSLSEGGSLPLQEYFTEHASEIIRGEGLKIASLDEDSVYYVRLYVQGEEYNNYVNSDAIYFELHTTTMGNVERAMVIVEKFSKYLLAGAVVLFFVLFVICTARFAVIKKSLGGRKQ